MGGQISFCVVVGNKDQDQKQGHSKVMFIRK